MADTTAIITRHDVTVFTVRQARTSEGAGGEARRVVMDDTEVSRNVELMERFARSQRHLALDFGHGGAGVGGAVPLPPVRAHERGSFAQQHGRNTLLDGTARAIRAVGATPEEAMRAWCEANDLTFDGVTGPLDGADGPGEWACTFMASGTGMKASGWAVPGGVVLTWLK